MEDEDEHTTRVDRHRVATLDIGQTAERAQSKHNGNK